MMREEMSGITKEAIRQSVDLAGQTLQALDVVDRAIKQAVEGKHRARVLNVIRA
jgi:hypothetical protein